MKVLPRNAKNIRAALQQIYDLTSSSEVREFLTEVVECLGRSLAENSDWGVNIGDMREAMTVFVFQEGKVPDDRRDYSSSQFAVWRMLKLLVGKEIPTEEEKDINNALAEHKGKDEYDIASFLEQSRDQSPEKVVKELTATPDRQNEKEESLQLPDQVRPDTQEATVYSFICRIERGKDREPGEQIGRQSDLREEIARQSNLSKSDISSAILRLARKGIVERKPSHGTYKVFRPEDSQADTDPKTDTKEQSAVSRSRSTRLSQSEKVERLLAVFRALLADKKNPRSLTHNVAGGQTRWLYVGRQDRIADDIESMAEFSSSQRISAINAAKSLGLMFIKGSRKSKKARYYLRADLAEDTAEDTDLPIPEDFEEGELKEQMEKLRNAQLPSLQAADEWKKLRKQARTLDSRAKQQGQRVAETIERLESRHEDIEKLRGDLEELLQLFEQGCQAAED
jgi:predicted transcriptional regulator